MTTRDWLARHACSAASVAVLLLWGCAEHRSREGLTTALVKASFECNPREIEKLVREGADVNAVGHPSGEKPLEVAASYGRVECVKKLLALGADPWLTGRSAEGEARPSIAVRQALVTLDEARRATPAQLRADLTLKKAIDRGVKPETYQEILRLLEAAEASRAHASN